ncbi:MAG: alpha/beta fold hydrolase, partial [Actinomycetota bacterium]
DDPSVPSSPGALVEDPLADFIAEQARLILQQPGIRPTDDLFAVGLDSLAAAELCGRIADAGLPRPAPTLLIHHRTPLQLADRIRSGWRQSNSTVVRVGQPHLPPMFFVPGGGSTALFINDVASFLGDRLRVVTVEPRGLHTDERRDHSVRRMASRVTEAIRAEGVTGPVALCGHSSGGVIAYEAAQQLVAQGHTVRLLLLDSRFLGNDGPPVFRWLCVWGNAVLRRARRLRHFIGGGAAETPATTQPTTRLTRYYERSMTVAWRATRRYRARRTSAELRCLHVAGFCGACALSIPGNRGTCLQIGGEHRTLARPQHLAAWAPEAADWLLGEA